MHGDLKGVRAWQESRHLDSRIPTQVNILINNEHHAVIADFGLTVVLSTNSATFMATTQVGGGTTRYMAPELLKPDAYGFLRCSPSKQSDMYAVGMVIYEVRHEAWTWLSHTI